jgi:hypothetical protein
VKVEGHVPPPLTSYLSKIFVKCFSTIVTSVPNQSCEHYLFSDALHIVITTSLKLKEETKSPPIHHVVMKMSWPSNILKEKCNVLNSFFSFLRKYEKRKTHNMLSLMLDHRHKNLHLLVSLFIAYEQGKTIVEEHDKRF